MDWSPTAVGRLATGDIAKAIHVWNPHNAGWVVDPVRIVTTLLGLNRQGDVTDW